MQPETTGSLMVFNMFGNDLHDTRHLPEQVKLKAPMERLSGCQARMARESWQDIQLGLLS